jgi:hypothetical protein
VILVLASRAALVVMRTWPPARRRLLRVKVHPDGGLWVAAVESGGHAELLALADMFGTRRWGPRGWRVLKPQLRLPGVVAGAGPRTGGRGVAGKLTAASPRHPPKVQLGPAQHELPGIATVERGP